MKKEKLIPKLIFFLLGMAIIQLGVVILPFLIRKI